METNANQRVTCIVNYPYEASEADELSLRVGDVVRGVERLGGGWWRGELRGRRGMFPDNFVTVSEGHRSPVAGRCRAVFSYQPANPDELPLCVGDVLEVLGEVEEGWWQGRRAGRVGVFPSNFVVMVDPQPAHSPPPPPLTHQTEPAPAPALPPKPVKEQCRVLFPYTAVNDDELTLSEGDIVSIISKEAPDRGWWRGELHGRQGLFPDNFVQLLPAPTVSQDVEEKKPERPPAKSGSAIYPILNKYSEKTASVKELTTSKISLHKENTVSKESSTHSTVTHTNRTESERIAHTDTVNDTSLDGQVKKPVVPAKKSPTPVSGVGGLLSGLKNKMMPNTDKDKDKDKERDKEKDKDKDKDKSSSTTISSSSSSGEWDKTDGLSASKPANSGSTFDHVERNSILNDPRAGRVKAPRRRPPSQALRDDTPPPPPAALSNGHHAPAEKPSTEKAEEIKPRAREWEKHKAPWMEELKLNQAKKTSHPLGDGGKSRSVSGSEGTGGNTKVTSGSTDRIVDVGVSLEEKRATHAMEMSKSTSSISTRISLIDNIEEKSTRHSVESKKDIVPPVPTSEPPAHSPTAAGRTFPTMLDDVKKLAPSPPTVLTRHNDIEKSPQKADRHFSSTEKTEKHLSFTEKTEKVNEIQKISSNVMDKSNSVKDRHFSSAEKLEKVNEIQKISVDKGNSVKADRRLSFTEKTDKVNEIQKISSNVMDKSNSVKDRHFSFTEMTEKLNDIQKISVDKGNAVKADRRLSFTEKTDKVNEIPKIPSNVMDKASDERVLGVSERVSTLERRRVGSHEDSDVLITHLNNRITNLEKLLEVQNAKFSAALEELSAKLHAETEKRIALQQQLDKLAHCVTSV